MKLPLSVLFIEDSTDDVLLLVEQLTQSGYSITYERVETVFAFRAALKRQLWDIVISGYQLPHCSALEVLQILQAKELDLPVIVVSEVLCEEAVVELIKAGAQDYLPFGYLKRFVAVVERELRDAAARQEKQRIEARLQQVFDELEILTQEAIEPASMPQQWQADQPSMAQVKDELISVISHELRTPLTSLQAAVELLMTDRLGHLSGQGKQLLEIAANNLDRLVQLSNNILDLEQFAAGQVTLYKQPCIVTTLLLQAVTTMQEMASRAGVFLSFTPCSAQILVDPKRIIQVLTNLLSNAIKFSAPGDYIRLSAELKQADSLGLIHAPYVLLSVTDEGEGIPSQSLETVFEHFYQVDTSDARRHNGAGLGLSVCRSIVQQHQGTVWVESTLGKGSTFYLALPVKPEPLIAHLNNHLVAAKN